LASSGEDSRITLWSVELQKVVTTLQEHSDCVKSVAFSPDGKYLACGSFMTIKLWSLETFKEVAVNQGHENYVN
jgi:WD40 repeat protein